MLLNAWNELLAVGSLCMKRIKRGEEGVERLRVRGGDPVSERGLTWDVFGLSCPAPPSHIPVPPHQSHRDLASSGTRLRHRCA